MYFIIISIISIFFLELPYQKKVECDHYKRDIQSSLPTCLSKQKVLPVMHSTLVMAGHKLPSVFQFWLPLARQPLSLVRMMAYEILIHPICPFFGHLQARLLLFQKTSIWQSKVKNSLGEPIWMINYGKSTEDRASTVASWPRGRRRYQNPWARWWWMKKRYHFDA